MSNKEVHFGIKMHRKIQIFTVLFMMSLQKVIDDLNRTEVNEILRASEMEPQHYYHAKSFDLKKTGEFINPQTNVLNTLFSNRFWETNCADHWGEDRRAARQNVVFEPILC